MQGKPYEAGHISSTEALQARREWRGNIKELKTKNFQPRFVYAAKLSLRIRQIKSFPDKQKLTELITTELALQEILT